MIALVACLGACHRQPEKSAELWLGGDVNLGDGGRGQLKGIASMVAGATGIVNLEGPVSQKLAQDRLRLWNAPSALPELSAIGIRFAGIANNHASDAGESGMQQTVNSLRATDILPAGGTAGAAFLSINGIMVAVTAHDLSNGVPAQLGSELAEARRRSDVLVATFHVTGAPSYLPAPELRKVVEIAYRAGANVIAAHGSHMLGAVERREHAVIAWGLGNVAFACDCTQEEDALILRITVQRGKVLRAEVLPLKAGIDNRAAAPSDDPKGVFDLLQAISGTKLQRLGKFALL